MVKCSGLGDLGIEVRGALAYIASFDGQNSITVVDALGTLQCSSSATAPP